MKSEIELGVEWNFPRFLIITGVGRSGTTILGKLLEAIPNTYVLYEPVIAKYMMGCADLLGPMFRALLMEDYYIPLIRQQVSDQKARRKDIVKYIQESNPLFVLKTLESQCYLPTIKAIFPDCKILHAIRNGYDVIGSTVNRGWYTAEYLEHNLIDYCTRYENCKIPWYMPADLRELFVKSNQVNRIALIWATLVEAGVGVDGLQEWRYECMMKSPVAHAKRLAELAGTKINHMDRKAILEITSHKTPTYPQPELTPKVHEIFRKVMALARYEI